MVAALPVGHVRYDVESLKYDANIAKHSPRELAQGGRVAQLERDLHRAAHTLGAQVSSSSSWQNIDAGTIIWNNILRV